jgi:hypothetical protein
MSNVFTVHHGRSYKAELQLSFFESFASEQQVAEKFEELGFINVVVTGSGSTRYAHGIWNGPDESVPLTDEHVVSVEEVHAPRIAMEAPARREFKAPMYPPEPERAPSGGIGEQGGYTGLAPEAPSEEVQPAVDPYTGPGENTGIVPPYLREKLEKEAVEEEEKRRGGGRPKDYDPFNPAHPGTEDTGGGG